MKPTHTRRGSKASEARCVNEAIVRMGLTLTHILPSFSFCSLQTLPTSSNHTSKQSKLRPMKQRLVPLHWQMPTSLLPGETLASPPSPPTSSSMLPSCPLQGS